VSSDSQRFLVNLTADERAATPITLILNWKPKPWLQSYEARADSYRREKLSQTSGVYPPQTTQAQKRNLIEPSLARPVQKSHAECV